jgi:tRNA threonylcarbamoyl adenosine modification protein YeaZ
MELIIDAAAQSPGAGLSIEGALHWTSGPLTAREHTRQLLPAILAGLQATSATFNDVSTIVVSLGPGPFNGLRVAVSIAKGLAAGTGAGIVGISTLEAEAYRCDASTGVVRPIVSAGRTGFATALYVWRANEWALVEEVRHIDATELSDIIDGTECLCGDVSHVVQALPPATSGQTLRTASGSQSRLEVLAALGWSRFKAGLLTPAAALQPLYARPPHITVARERRP